MHDQANFEAGTLQSLTKGELEERTGRVTIYPGPFISGQQHRQMFGEMGTCPLVCGEVTVPGRLRRSASRESRC